MSSPAPSLWLLYSPAIATAAMLAMYLLGIHLYYSSPSMDTARLFGLPTLAVAVMAGLCVSWVPGLGLFLSIRMGWFLTV
ncbi:MAG: hypothetical protein ACI8S6_003429 [Myxococcota bacterium]|jgi:hypothetical protein